MKFNIVKNYRKDAGGKMLAEERTVVEFMLANMGMRPMVKAVKSGKQFLLRENLSFGKAKPTVNVLIGGKGVNGTKRFDIKPKK